MKLNKFFMLGLAGLAFAACSNDDNAVNGGNEDGKVRITLSLGKTETTRSLGQTAAELYNKITDLDVVFYNNANSYVEAPETVAEDSEYSKSSVISKAVSDLESGHTATLVLKGIPASAAKVYIVANQNNKSHGVDISSLDAAKNTLIYLNEQVKTTNYTDFSGEESHMTGLSSIGADNSVKVELRAVPSRIELQKVNAKPMPTDGTWGGTEITSFTVLGFYVNAFYTTGHLDPAIDKEEGSSRTKIDGESVASNYDAKESGTGLYKDTWKFMCDEPTDSQINYAEGTFDATDDPDGFLYTATPNPETNYWGYHILQGDVPHVVVKLNVTYSDNTTAIKFLTITNYTYANNFSEPNNGPTHNQGELVGEVLRGHVYRINNINFDVTDLTDVPYEGTKTVTATVSVLPWVGVDVNPEFN